MIRKRWEKLADHLRKNRIDHVLLSSNGSLRYFTGYTPPVDSGPSPFAPVIGVFLWVHGEGPTLYLADMESQEDVYPDLERETFRSYTVDKPLGAVADLTSKLLRGLKHLRGDTVGIEAEELPAAVLQALAMEYPNLEFRDIRPLLTQLWRIKDSEEIKTTREALALCDVGQELAKKLACPGISELELFAEIRKGMEAKAGRRVPLVADFVSGPRTGSVGGPPRGRVLEAGDLLLVDLVPQFKGYWGDSCNTIAVGEPSGECKKLFQGVKEALADGIEQIRPALQACALDSLVRQKIERLGGGYPHHTGHGLGPAWHEEPRIVPGNSMPLEPGMVIALEPGIYFEGRWGLRLESVVLVTETGAEVFSNFQHHL